MATLHEGRTTKWQAQWLQWGHDQDIERGKVEGWMLMCRQVKRKFDGETTEWLSGLPDGFTDPEYLAEVGEWNIECETAPSCLTGLNG